MTTNAPRVVLATALFGAVVLVIAAWARGDDMHQDAHLPWETGPSGQVSQLALTSPRIAAGGAIPPEYTCEGKNLFPPLRAARIPEGTRSLALVVDDPDAPDPRAPKLTWVHLVLYNLPPTTADLPEGLKPFPPGAVFGVNSSGNAGWDGPCPPIGEHRYFFKLFALDTVLAADAPLTAPQLQQAMTGHVLGRTELVGRYQQRKLEP